MKKALWLSLTVFFFFFLLGSFLVTFFFCLLYGFYLLSTPSAPVIMRCGIKFKMQVLFADKGQPSSIVKSIVPAQNHFVFFEVSAASFHQVRIELW